MSKMSSIETINCLVQAELELASAKHGGKFSSHHEAYAVLLEEFTEMSVSMCTAEQCMDKYWNHVMYDWFEKIDQPLNEMETFMIQVIQEGIQVLAMIEKARKYIK